MENDFNIRQEGDYTGAPGLLRGVFQDKPILDGLGIIIGNESSSNQAYREAPAAYLDLEQGMPSISDHKVFTIPASAITPADGGLFLEGGIQSAGYPG